MNALKISLSLILLIAILANCTDQDIERTIKDRSSKSTAILSYANLEVGNYWIYEEIHMNKEGELVRKFTDSVFVAEIERYAGNDYFALVGHAVGTQYPTRYLLRDSLNYLVDNHGNILLTSEVLDRVIQTKQRAEYTLKSTMHLLTALTVNSTEYFDVINRIEEIVFTKPLESEPFFNDNQYANGVGLLRQTRTFWTSGVKVERRLLRFGK